MARKNEPFILAQHDEILQFIGRNKQDFGDLQDKGIRWAVQAEVPLYLQLLEIVVDEQANGPRRAKWAAALMSNQKGAKDAQNKIRRKIIYVLRGETNYRYEGKLKETLLADFKRKDRGKRSAGPALPVSPLCFKRPFKAPPATPPLSPSTNWVENNMDVDDVEPATQDILGKTISDLQNFLANRPDRHEMMQDALTPLLKTIKRKPIPGAKDNDEEFEENT